MKMLSYPFSVLRLIPSFKCNFTCEYCSCSKYQEDLCRTSMYVNEEPDIDLWIKRMEHIKPQRLPLKVMFCAGEPAIAKDFHKIINTLDREHWMTLIYTNLSDRPMKEIMKMNSRDNLKFYISYHPVGIKRDNFIANAIELISKHKNIMDFHGVPHPNQKDTIEEDAKEMLKHGIPLRTKHPYVVTKFGEYNFYDKIGELPKFKNRFASRINGTPMKTVYCKTSFNHHTHGISGLSYPVAPNGNMYICWRYMLNHSDEGIVGNFLDDDFECLEDKYYECPYYGDCNACAWDKNIIDKETGKQLDTDVVGWECKR